ncbi:CMYA5 protein, partial [Crypturellus undulatus]|nr:CMYA5 protein [Crypturellus undulatus]
EQRDLFNIISEGYEILNIHAPTHISSVDQEESKHMPDKLEYLETKPLFKRRLAEDGHRALASGTIMETSESSVLENLGSKNHKVEELVKDTTEETGETEMDESTLPENKNDTVLDPNNGMADMDYFEKYTLIDDRSPIKPDFESPSSLVSATEHPKEPAEDPSFKESSEANTLEEDFSLLEDLDEVFYGTIKGESIDSYASVSKLLPAQKSIEISSKKAMNIEDERKSPGTPLFDSEEGVLERSLLFPTSVAAVNPELLEEPPALSFLYKDLYAEAMGAKTKEETPSDEESGNSNASFPSRNSDTDDGTGIYFEKYILKDEIPVKAIDQPQQDEILEDLPVSGDISYQSSGDKHEQWSGDVSDIRIDSLPDWRVVEREKVQVDSDIKAAICKPTHAIPFGSKVNILGARSATSEQREENIPVETTEELPEANHQECGQRIDYEGAAFHEAANKQEEQHEIAAVYQMEKYIPRIRTPVEDSEDDQYAQADLSHVPSIQPTEKPDTQREEQCPGICEDLAEVMDYDVITQEELLQDEMSSELTHEELLFEDRDSFEHIGDSYEFVEEPEQRTPVELEDSGFVVMYPEKSPTNVPQVESPQKELKKAQVDTYCYHCKTPISAIEKLFGEHKDHEVTTLDAAATRMKDQLDELLMALEEKSMKIEGFVSEIESLFNSVEENCKKNAEFLEKQNEDMIKKVVAQYDEKSENFEEVKKMKMEYLYEQMVNFQQTVDSAKETLERTVKEMEELDGFVFLNGYMGMWFFCYCCCFPNRLLSAMDTTLSLEKVPSSFSLFEHYADSPGKSDRHPLNRMAVPQTPTLIAQEPNSATSTSIAVYWTVNEGDAIDCFQVYCMEEPQANRDQSALVEEYRVTVKESHCILEDLEPDRCYSVWVMAVNCTGCSLPSEKAIFKTAPAVPVIRAEDCTVCWDTATVRWRPGPHAPRSFTLEYCPQRSPEGEGLRS